LIRESRKKLLSEKRYARIVEMAGNETAAATSMRNK